MKIKIEKIFLIFIFILSILARIDYEINFLDFYTDKAYQVFAAENYINGFGVSVIGPNLSDLTKNIVVNPTMMIGNIPMSNKRKVIP